MVSGYDMKAKPNNRKKLFYCIYVGLKISNKLIPVPLLTTCEMSLIPRLWARLPKIENIVMPAKNDVNVSMVVTIIASLKKCNLDFFL